jgi:hypothetical protein
MEIKHFLEKVSEDDFKWEKQYEVDVEEELTKGIENIKVRVKTAMLFCSRLWPQNARR